MLRLTVIILVIVSAMVSCKKHVETKDVESKWRVLDKQEYDPQIDEAGFPKSLEEVEKLILAPLFYFEKDATVQSFSQKMSFVTVTELEKEMRTIELNEKTSYTRDAAGNFKLSYSNEKNEGWDMVWFDGFIYKKMLGGEYTKTFSGGEHNFYRESFFKIIPDMYSIFRENAHIEKSDERKVVIKFSDAKEQVKDLPQRKYLQNAYGMEEIRNDQLAAQLRGKKKDSIQGTLEVHFTADRIVSKLILNLSFNVSEEKVKFNITGERDLLERPLEKFAVPQYSKEYHIRSFDASKNILQGDDKNGKK